ncbi:hypothetical protein LWI29_028996 [Acer saccharum]|uniref:Uncharacterized protein n=1 Tax=Acer saccharum TaxID=4024 RepID=A0AA39S2G2_ACESA|nr:hypothetical protein LWI29_028996 [Acer saccharum]
MQNNTWVCYSDRVALVFLVAYLQTRDATFVSTAEFLQEIEEIEDQHKMDFLAKLGGVVECIEHHRIILSDLSVDDHDHDHDRGNEWEKKGKDYNLSTNRDDLNNSL